LDSNQGPPGYEIQPTFADFGPEGS
jgi:hypothetical protein